MDLYCFPVEGECMGSDQNSKQESIQAMQNLSAE